MTGWAKDRGWRQVGRARNYENGEGDAGGSAKGEVGAGSPGRRSPKPAGDWISVEDELPPKDVWVLVTSGRWIDPEFEIAAWTDDGWRSEFVPIMHEPTHWILLERPE